MRIITIVGARPQFVKASMVSSAIASCNDATKGCGCRLEEEIIHTGQHYDDNMSRVFFEQMGIPQPKYNLGIGSGNHGVMTGRMLEGIERILLDKRPDWVLVYGDTNSTLAGALAASKLHIPVAHVEAGLRSFNRQMPEEINRVLTDHVAAALFCPTTAAVKNLDKEGISEGVLHVGDVMYDAALLFGRMAEKHSKVLDELKVQPKEYVLATVHRAENTDDPNRLAGIFQAFNEIASPDRPLVLPLHPRTQAALMGNGLGRELKGTGCEAVSRVELKNGNPSIILIPPVSFLDMIMLEKNARVILTDSGGVQKEAYFHGVPCVTLRDETEWIETVDAGWNTLAGARSAVILESVKSVRHGSDIPEYGTGCSAERIVQYLAG